MHSACSNLDLLTPKCFVRRRTCRVFLAMQFNVFTVGKNTRNRQFIYFYLPPYSFCRLRVSCSKVCCLRTGPFKTFSIFLFAILTVSIAIAAYIVLKLSNVSVQKLKRLMKRILMVLIIRYNLRSVRMTTYIPYRKC